MKYIKPEIEVISVSPNQQMLSASILGGDTTTQLGKSRNGGFEYEEEEYEEIGW